MDAITDQIDAKFKQIDDLIIENKNLPLPVTYEEYTARENAHNMQIEEIKKEIVDLFKQNPLYKRLFQMKAYGLL